MNTIAVEMERRLLDGYLCNDLVDSPDTSVARAKQMKGIETFKETMRLHTVKTMQDNEFQKIYVNSFSRCRSRFDEYSRVDLT